MLPSAAPRAREERRQRAALEDARVHWEGVGVPAVEGDACCRAAVQELHPAQRSGPKADCHHAPLDPGPVETVEGLIEVQEHQDCKGWFIRLIGRSVESVSGGLTTL